MLNPQSSLFRQYVDLAGFWELRFDPQDEGHSAGGSAGFRGGRPVAVPASWNDQFEDRPDYLGRTWYQRTFDLPWGWDPSGQHLQLRFGSANYFAEVWLNDVRLGVQEGGHLPLERLLTVFESCGEVEWRH